jgi:hypothetical protein
MAQRQLQLPQSSMISGATYDDETGELLVSFTNSGAVYAVSSVDPGTVLNFEGDSSPGRFWNSNFRGSATRVS